MINRFLLISAFAAFLLPSCVTENALCPSTGRADEFMLNLNIAAGNISTRAFGHDMDYDAPYADNYINPEDLCVYILNSSGTIIERFEPTSKQLTAEGLCLRGLYAPKSDEFRIMAMANWQTRFGGDYETNISESTTLTGLYTDVNNFNFTMPAGEEGASWIPSAGISGIPMFGLSVENIAVPEKTGGFVPELDVKAIPMLRALAKIEVINKTNDEDIKITAVRLTDYVPTGRFIPDGSEGKNEDWNIWNIQVAEPSLPFAAATKSEALRFAAGNGETFTAYIPEMDLNGLGDRRPYLEVDISIDNDAPITYPVKFGKYEGGKCVDETYPAALLRNHRYEFDINSVEKGVSVDLTLIVDTDWEVYDSEFDYRDAAAVFEAGKHFTWTTSTFEESGLYDKRTLLVDPTGGAEASFTMTEPKLGTWTLALYGSDDTHNDAFRIEIWDDEANDGDGGWNTRDGESPDAITRPVDGKEVKIRIVATGPSDSAISYTARLVMTVKTFDDRIAEVNLPHAEDNPMLRPTIENSGYYFVKQTNSGL